MFWAGVIIGLFAAFVVGLLWEVWDRWRYERDWQPDRERFDDERGLL